MDEGVAWYPAPPLPMGERRIEYPCAGGKDGDFFSEDAAGILQREYRAPPQAACEQLLQSESPRRSRLTNNRET